jgi:two-component system, NarL family, sensor histidine kinase UhpB
MWRSSRIKVLFIQNERDGRNQVQQKLARWGYTVDIVKQGSALMTQSLAKGYDLLVIDQANSSAESLEILNCMASKRQLPPTIMVTGPGIGDIITQAGRLGVRDFIIRDSEGGYLDLLPAFIEKVLENTNHRFAESRAI